MPDADTPYNSGFSGWFVQNMFQHHSVLAPTGCGDHQPLLRLAQGEGRVVVLHGKVRRRDPIEVIADRSRLGVRRVTGRFAVVRTPSPQRGDVFVGQVHVIANIHGPTCVQTYRSQWQLCSSVKESDPTPAGGKKEEASVNQCRRAGFRSLLVNGRAPGINTH